MQAHAAAGAVRQHSLWSTDSPTPSNVMAAAKTIAACRERILAAGQAHDHFIWDDIHYWTAKKWAVLLKNRSPRTIIMKSLVRPASSCLVRRRSGPCMHAYALEHLSKVASSAAAARTTQHEWSRLRFSIPMSDEHLYLAQNQLIGRWASSYKHPSHAIKVHCTSLLCLSI